MTKIASNVHSCALKNDNTVWYWGTNTYGDLGDGTTTDRWVPVQVQNLPSGTLIDLAVRDTNTCVLVGQGASPTSGAVYCWGNNDRYELAGSAASSNAVTTPTLLSGLTSGVTSLLVNTRLNCVMQNGELKCWSYGDKIRNQAIEYSAPPLSMMDWAY